MPLISVIVLNWNGKAIIEACLNSLLDQTHTPFEIILVDNGSTDGSPQLLESKYVAKISLIKSKINTGFAGGVDIGIQHSKGEFIALFNSDAVAEKNWLSELMSRILESPSIGMCASKIYLSGSHKIFDNTGEVISRDGLGKGRGRLEKDTGQYDLQTDVLCPSGCAALYRRQMLEEIGGMDTRFFAYGEDIDIGLRGRMLGYKAVFCPKAIVHHALSASSSLVSPLKAFYVERNRLWIVLKCFPLPHLAAAAFYSLQRYFYHFQGLFSRRGPASQYVEKFSWPSLLLTIIKVYLSTFWNLPYLMRKRAVFAKKTTWNARDFEACLKRYGISARDAALQELG